MSYTRVRSSVRYRRVATPRVLYTTRTGVRRCSVRGHRVYAVKNGRFPRFSIRTPAARRRRRRRRFPFESVGGEVDLSKAKDDGLTRRDPTCRLNDYWPRRREDRAGERVCFFFSPRANRFHGILDGSPGPPRAADFMPSGRF